MAEAKEFAARAKQGRPVVDESLCFVCQDPANPVVWIATRNKQQFYLCKDCHIVVAHENQVTNDMKRAIQRHDHTHIFEYCLGANLLPIQIKLERIAKEV